MGKSVEALALGVHDAFADKGRITVGLFSQVQLGTYGSELFVVANGPEIGGKSVRTSSQRQTSLEEQCSLPLGPFIQHLEVGRRAG